MARKVPHNFLESGEKAVATFDWFDLADGSGFVNMYGANTQSGAILLKTGDYFSNDVFTDVDLTSSDFTKEIDLDFDVAINLPLRIKGTAYVNTGLEPYVRGNADNQGRAYAILKLIRVRGGVETVIAQATSRTVKWHNGREDYSDETDGNWKISRITGTQITVPNTLYKKGDTLRLTVEVWANKTGTAIVEATVKLFHDPKGRIQQGVNASQVDTDGNQIESGILILSLPVVIDR